MNLKQLNEIREQLTDDLYLNTKENNFSSRKAYQAFINSKHEGIVEFYALAMLQIFDNQELPTTDKSNSPK